jgi:hypothetical protein
MNAVAVIEVGRFAFDTTGIEDGATVTVLVTGKACRRGGEVVVVPSGYAVQSVENPKPAQTVPA